MSTYNVSNRELQGGASWVVGSKLKILDSAVVGFGTGTAVETMTSYDLSLQWDGTNFIVTPLTDDTLIEIGDSAVSQVSWDLKWYANEASGASYLYADASANLLYTVGVDFQLKDNDVLAFGTGSSAAGDVSITWDATNLIIKTAADESLIEIGDSAATQLSLDVKWYANEANGASYLYQDASANLIYTTGVDLQFKDSDYLVFGTGSGASGDVNVTWDGTNLILATIADDKLIEIGDSAATQLSFDLKWYANENNGASYLYADASDNLLYTTGVDLQFKDNDYLVFGTGASAAGDVNIRWDATNLLIEAVADDSIIEFGDAATPQKSFDIKVYGDAANGADYALFDAGASKLTTVGAYYIGGRTDDAAGRGLVLSVRTTSSALTTSGAVTGAIVFNTLDNKIYVYGSSSWIATGALS